MPGKVPRLSKEDEELYGLRPSEIVWRDRQKMLEQHGYLLRPRFRPGWVPSWLGTNKSPLLFEDALSNGVSCRIQEHS